MLVHVLLGHHAFLQSTASVDPNCHVVMVYYKPFLYIASLHCDVNLSPGLKIPVEAISRLLSAVGKHGKMKAT
jgi:hypothetical protein